MICFLFDFSYVYLDTGDMTTMERDLALKNIAENDKCTVIIVSILAGGVGKSIYQHFQRMMKVECVFFFYHLFILQGLNITCCNTVIILEPWWNPYVEVS